MRSYRGGSCPDFKLTLPCLGPVVPPSGTKDTGRGLSGCLQVYDYTVEMGYIKRNGE